MMLQTVPATPTTPITESIAILVSLTELGWQQSARPPERNHRFPTPSRKRRFESWDTSAEIHIQKIRYLKKIILNRENNKNIPKFSFLEQV